MNTMIIETRSVCKKYGSFSAVSDMDIRVRKGSVYALIGQNGAGKTTLLKMLCGLTPVTSGEISLFGECSPRGLEKVRARTGAMIETPAFLPYLSAKDNLKYLCIQRGENREDSINNVLKFVGLDDTGKKHFGSFSLGMKQRLGLALAVMDDAELLILDEPINGLDPMGIREFRDIILRLNKEKGITVLISSHILGELSQIATDYSFIDHGRLLRHDTATELMEKCRSFLRIDVDDIAKASEVLRGTLGCTKFTCSGNTIHMEERMDEPEEFVQALTKSGIAVFQICREGISLEQYFIDLIKGGNADA